LIDVIFAAFSIGNVIFIDIHQIRMSYFKNHNFILVFKAVMVFLFEIYNPRVLKIGYLQALMIE